MLKFAFLSRPLFVIAFASVYKEMTVFPFIIVILTMISFCSWICWSAPGRNFWWWRSGSYTSWWWWNRRCSSWWWRRCGSLFLRSFRSWSLWLRACCWSSSLKATQFVFSPCGQILISNFSFGSYFLYVFIIITFLIILVFDLFFSFNFSIQIASA